MSDQENSSGSESDGGKRKADDLYNPTKKISASESSGSTVFVGNLSFQTTEDDLKEYFEKTGEVLSTRVITDKFTQKSKGFGYVEFKDSASAQEAISNLNGTDLNGRQIRVDAANDRKRDGERSDRGRGGFGGRGRGGDFRGGRGGRGGGFRGGRGGGDRDFRGGRGGGFRGGRGGGFRGGRGGRDRDD